MEVNVPSDASSLRQLGLGTAQFGNLFQVLSDDEVAELFETAWAAGVRLFDTAPHYGLGLAESRLGELLATKPRHEYRVSTKVGRLLEPNPNYLPGELDPEGFQVEARVRRRWDFSRDGIRASIDASLERLGLDRVDILYAHDPDNHMPEVLETGMPALLELRDEGIVSAVGAGMNDADLLADIVERHDVDMMMLAGRYTLLEQPALDRLLPLAEQRGVQIVAAGVYNSGILATTQPNRSSNYNYSPAPQPLIERAERIAAHCARHGVDLPTAAVAFPLRHPAVSAVVLGASSAHQVAQNVQRFTRNIPEAFWQELAAAGVIPADPGAASSR